MSLLPKSIHRCRRYPTKFNSGRDIPLERHVVHRLYPPDHAGETRSFSVARRSGFHRGHLGFHANLDGHDTRQVDWITTGSVSRPLRRAKNPAGFCATATLARESLTGNETDS